MNIVYEYIIISIYTLNFKSKIIAYEKIVINRENLLPIMIMDILLDK